MRINQGELAELLEDEIDCAEVFFDEGTGTMQIALYWDGWGRSYHVNLEHQISDQIYRVIYSTSPEMIQGNTISVDEILDIVL